LKITPPSEELSDEPDIRDYQLARQKHEFEGAPEPVSPRRPVVLDAPLFGGKYTLGSAPYERAGLINRALNLAYGQKMLPLYFTPLHPLARAADAYEIASHIAENPKEPVNYIGVPGTVVGAGRVAAPMIGAGASAGAGTIVAKDKPMHDDVKDALRIANQMPASWRDKRLPQMSETPLDDLRKASEKYPFIQKHNPSVSYNTEHPNPGNWVAETFAAGSPGYEGYPRPEALPKESTGIEVYKPSRMGPNDIAAEYLHVDPRAHQAREQLLPTFNEHQLRILKEQGDYKPWPGSTEELRMNNVTDALMRGYVMDQWPKEAIDEMQLNKDQHQILDDLKDYTQQPQERAQGGSVHDYLSAEDRRLLDYIMSHDEPGFEERKSGGRINGVLDYDPDWDMHLRKGYATDGSVEGDVQFAPDDYKPEEEAKQHAPAPMMAQHDYAMHMPQPEVRYDTGPHAGEPTLKAAPEPTTREQIAQTMLGNERPSPERRQFVEGLLGTSGLGQQHMGAADFVPLAGQALQAQESYQHKDPKGFLMATVPVPGAAIEGKLAQAGRTAIEAAAPVVQHAAEQVVGAVAPQMTKSQSQEAMRQAWAAGQGNTDKYKTWNHQWNMEEGPKFRVAQPEVPAVGPGTVVQKKPVGFQLPDPYERVTNPAGFYSHGAEASRGLPQQKGTLEQMLAALKGYGVKPEEIRWSGVEQAFTGRPHVTGEELAQHFEQRLPKINRITKAEESDIDHYRLEELQSEEYQRIYDDDFQNDLENELENHDLEDMSEGQIERLRDRLEQQITENYWERANENAYQLAQEEAAENGPKWGGTQYNFPGGEDYFENILTLPYRDMSGIHPDVIDRATSIELKELEDAWKSASRDNGIIQRDINNKIKSFHEENLDQIARKEIEELRASGHRFTTDEEVMDARRAQSEAEDTYYRARSEWKTALTENMPPAEATVFHAKMEEAQKAQRDAYDAYMRAKANNESNYFYDRVDTLRNQFSPEALAEHLGKMDEYRAIENSPKSIEYSEKESKAAEAFKSLENDLLEASKAHWGKHPEYEGEFFQHMTHLGDITNPILHGRFQTHEIRDPETGNMLKVLNESESQSDWSKENFARQLSDAEKEEVDLLSAFATRTPEQNLRLSELLSSVSAPGKTKEVPYVGKLKNWADLSAKDALAHAIENGFDRIFITGGQEQAKRWSRGMRSAAENISWRTPSDADSYNLPSKVLEPYSHAMFGKQYYDLTENEQNAVRSTAGRIAIGHKQNIFPDNIHAVPDAGKIVNIRMADGSDAKLVVKSIVQPNGQVKNIVMESNKSSVVGENLSAVVGSDLEKQIMASEDGHKDLSNYMMGAAGYEHIYDKEKPDAYKRIIKSLDPNAKVEAGTMPTPMDSGRHGMDYYGVRDIADNMTPEQREKFKEPMHQLLEGLDGSSYQQGFYLQWMRHHAPYEFRNFMKQFENENRQGTWVHITPKMRDEYNRLKREYGAVFPAYKRGGAVKDSVSKIGNQMSKVRDSVMKLAQGGSAVDDALRMAKQGRFPLHQAIARTGYDDGGPVWDKPRPKKLGKPEPLSKKEKASAKAAAKAAGRPWPNLVDNMRAAKAAGGEVDDALRLAKGGKTPAWQRAEGKNPNGGLNAKGRASAKAEGHDLKPPQPEGGPRKDSFCSRMTGMKKKLTSKETANDPNSRINKSLRAWNC
jgi:hypothetical protein